MIVIPKNLSARIKKPVFIEGLPGVGNVGKITVDFLVEQTGAKPILKIPVERKPGLVLVQQNNMVRFPEIILYHYCAKGRDFLFLTGEGQPAGEGEIYDLALRIVELLARLKCSEIITLGGIGLQQVPDTPTVFVTGNNKVLIAKLKKAGADPKIHGVVGPIIGLTGVLLAVGDKKIPAAALLAESTSHPFFLGLRGAEQLLSTLAKAYGFRLDTKKLQASIAAIEEAMRGSAPAGELPKDETNYIG